MPSIERITGAGRGRLPRWALGCLGGIGIGSGVGVGVGSVTFMIGAAALRSVFLLLRPARQTRRIDR